jgi:hypothetical protein
VAVMRWIECSPEYSQPHYCSLFREFEKLVSTFL